MIRTIFLPHVAAAIITTALSGFIYVSVQQQYRTGADDPQTQIARDIAYKLAQNKTASEQATADTINLEQSLGTFMQLYDGAGKLTYSNGFIGTTAPTAPDGVLAEAKLKGEYGVSWQPARNVRLASVIVYTGGERPGYVLVGRSLWEVEKRENNLLTMTFLCWLVCMGVICVHALLQGWLARKEKRLN